MTRRQAVKRIKEFQLAGHTDEEICAIFGKTGKWLFETKCANSVDSSTREAYFKGTITRTELMEVFYANWKKCCRMQKAK